MADQENAGGRGLTADQVVEAAIGLVEEQGLERLTIRRLAEACGATPMTLYRHVRDKADLERMVAERFLDRVPAARLLADWRDAVGELLAGLRRVLFGCPGIGRLVVQWWGELHGRTRIMDQLYGILLDAGYAGPDVVIAADAIELYALGSICHDLGVGGVGGDGATARLAHISVAGTPNLVEFAAYLVKRDADVMFASGLDALIRGLEATLQPASDQR